MDKPKPLNLDLPLLAALEDKDPWLLAYLRKKFDFDCTPAETVFAEWLKVHPEDATHLVNVVAENAA